MVFRQGHERKLGVTNDYCNVKNMVSIPVEPITGWRKFPSQGIPTLFNYGHVHYALESIQSTVVSTGEENDHGLGHMMDKPMKNARKYVDSGFVHDVMDAQSADHYFVRAHVWSSHEE